MKKNVLRKVLSATLVSFMFLQVFYVALEAKIASAVSDSIIVTLVVDNDIAISTPADVTMSPNIGLVSNVSTGNAIWNVKSNDPQGYTLALKASTSPALEVTPGGISFADYTPVSAEVPELWSVGTGTKEFGYSVFGADTVASALWGTGSSCATGSAPSTTLKYRGTKLADFTVATRANVTPFAGVDTTVCFGAEQKDVWAPSGTYTATITATATVI